MKWSFSVVDYENYKHQVKLEIILFILSLELLHANKRKILGRTISRALYAFCHLDPISMSLFCVLLLGWEFDIRRCYEILNGGMLYIPT